MTQDTIFAVSSGQPPAAIAVVRISGPIALGALARLTDRATTPRHATLRRLRDPDDGRLLDRALILSFPAPNSATGEDLCELHLHGGRAVVAAVLDVLGKMEGLRPAQPGEFTRRALAMGRIDLAEAEALGDLLAAETESQRRAAVAAVEGSVSRAVAAWTQRLLAASARVEAALDFSDEGDVGEASLAEMHADIARLIAAIDAVVTAPPVERLHAGLRVVLAGPPNSGKSSLFNAMLQRDAAIVSPIAGTTRDRIEAGCQRDGIAYLLSDTAGLAAATADPIEAIGITRAHDAMTEADILVWLDDSPPPRDDALWLWPRADARPPNGDPRRLAVSAVTGRNIPELWALLAERAMSLLPRIDQLSLNRRQRALCMECLSSLNAAGIESDLLIVAEHLRLARRSLDQITGIAGTEAMLDALFGQFCIGK